MKAATNDGVHIVYDTISEDYTYPLILGTIAEGKPAKVSALHKLPPEVIAKREDVKWHGGCTAFLNLRGSLKSLPLRHVHLYRIRTDR